MNRSFTIAGITASVIIGAGFATGSETKKYFTDYGTLGYGIMALCAVLLTLSAIFVTGCRRRPLKFIAGAYVFFSYVLMLAALGELTESYTCFPWWTGILSGGMISALAVLAGFGKFNFISGILTPVIALTLTAMAVFVFNKQPFLVSLSPQKNVLSPCLAVIFFCGYNFLSQLSVLPDIAVNVRRGRKIVASVIGMLSVFACIFILNGIFSVKYNIVGKSDMPLTTLLLSHDKITAVTALSLLTAVFLLSACGSAVSFARMWPDRAYERKAGLIMTAVGMLAALPGFGMLMDRVYPLFGIAGFAVMLVYLTGIFKKSILKRSKK